MLNLDLSQFLYKLAASAVIGVIMATVLWPFRKARKEWSTLKTNIAATHAELVQQRTNCLQTLQDQGVRQIELLGKTVDLLDGVRLDLKEQTGYLRASATPSVRRRAAKK